MENITKVLLHTVETSYDVTNFPYVAYLNETMSGVEAAKSGVTYPTIMRVQQVTLEAGFDEARAIEDALGRIMRYARYNDEHGRLSYQVGVAYAGSVSSGLLSKILLAKNTIAVRTHQSPGQFLIMGTDTAKLLGIETLGGAANPRLAGTLLAMPLVLYDKAESNIYVGRKGETALVYFHKNDGSGGQMCETPWSFKNYACVEVLH